MTTMDQIQKARAVAVTPGDEVQVRWSGAEHVGTVVRVYKNGNVTVDLDGLTEWTGGRMGHRTKPPRVKVEPWQIINPTTEAAR